MATLWFILVAFMLAAYVLLDGFDLGAGIVHFGVGRDDSERRVVLSSIGPVWDGNEVWLLAAGGTLYFAFPMLYSSSFSGFYLPLMIVLWLLMLRGISVELRGHVDDAMWRAFFDRVFALSSALLAVFFGAALANVIRGVPLGKDGFFFEPLWTTFTTGGNTGILDWYTVLGGMVALVALAMHGANYLAAKTDGEMNGRARRISTATEYGLAVLTPISLVATVWIRPVVLDNYRNARLGLAFPVLVAGGIAAMHYYRRRGADLKAFFGGCAYLVGMLGGAAFALYPRILPTTGWDQTSLTIWNSAAPEYGLKVGLVWWAAGATLAAGYFFYLYRSFRSKVTTSSLGSAEEGY